MVANKPLTHTNKINFLPETKPYLTPFRESAIRQIFDTAREISPFQITEAVVEFTDLWEPDSWSLNLVLHTDSDWDGAHWLTREICDRYPRWFIEFTGDGPDEFVVRVQFGVTPQNR